MLWCTKHRSGRQEAECDISVSKLLGFETFPFFLMVSVSVSEIFGIEKSIGIGFEKKLVSEKVSVSVSIFFGIEKSIGIGFEKNLVLKNMYESVSKQFG